MTQSSRFLVKADIRNPLRYLQGGIFYMNIAIVDDLASDRLQLIGKLQAYLQQARIPFT